MHFLLEMGSKEIASYVFGIIGLICFASSFQAKKRWLLLILQSVGLLAFGIQYFFLDSIIGLITEIVCVARNVTFVFRNKNKFFKSIWLPIIFIVIELIVTVTNYSLGAKFNWIDILPIAGFIAQTVAICYEKELTNRIIFLISSPIWFTYNILTHAVFGATTDILNTISIVIMIIRIIKANKKEVITPVEE